MGTTLRFTRVSLENWRNFTKVDVELQRRVFLIGPNASGKSNFLDVFRFLRDIVSVGGGLEAAVIKNRGGVSKLRSLAARRYSDVRISVRLGEEANPRKWEYIVQINQDSRKRPVIRREQVSRSGEVILARPDSDDEKDPERLTQTYLQQVNMNQAFREVAEYLASVRYLHLVPQLVREPDRSVGRQNDPYGGDVLEQIAGTPEKTQKAWLKRIGDALRVAVPQLKELKLERDNKGRPHLHGNYEHWRPRGAWQTEEEFSDGTLRLLGLLWAILEGRGPLLLEEPELSLHPEVVRFVPQMFARAQVRTGRQVLISTHSSELLQDEGIGLDEVLLLSPGREGTSVTLASESEGIRTLVESGIPVGEAVMPQTAPRSAWEISRFAG